MWEYSYIGDTQNVDAAIRRLRKKIENDPAPVIITTKKEDLDNVSYKFQREIPQAKDRLINTVILIEDTIIYHIRNSCIDWLEMVLLKHHTTVGSIIRSYCKKISEDRRKFRSKVKKDSHT